MPQGIGVALLSGGEVAPARGARTITPKVFANASPAVELWQPWDQVSDGWCNPEGVRCLSTHWNSTPNSLSQGFKANPGLELANTFGLKLCQQEKQELIGLLHRKNANADF